MMAEAETLDSTDTPHFRRHFFHKSCTEFHHINLLNTACGQVVAGTYYTSTQC